MNVGGPGLKRELSQLLSLAASDPAQFWERIYRTVGLLRAKLVFRGVSCGERVYVGGRVALSSRGQVIVGDRVQFLPGMIPMRVLVHPGGELRIGADTGLNYGVSIEARTRVAIGERCMLGTMVRITDTLGSQSAPVTIGDDVWLAHGVVIEPGVTIGSGAVVTAGSVVRQDVPAASIALGNPAKSVPLPGRSRFLSAQAPEAVRRCSERTAPGASAGI